MSGLAVLLSRDGGPADAATLRRMLARLEHRGPDGERVVTTGSLALGHRHFWTTPEEAGEEQPIADGTGRWLAAVDGRVDNRDEVGRSLSLTAAETAELSDASLMLRVFTRWGLPGLGRVVGSFAAVFWDAAARRLTLARDALGDRSLCWAVTPGFVVAASEEQAVLAHLQVDSRLDDRRLAQFFAVGELDSDATYFAAVKTVLPGHAIVVENGSCAAERYVEVGGGAPLRLRDDREYAEAFREALTASVRARVRAPSPVALFLSGGLDSSAIAAVAATLAPRPDLTAISWVFDELAECDERAWIAPIVRHLGLDWRPFVADGEWTGRELESWRRNPSSPDNSVFRRVTERAYATAAATGAPVVLSGLFGDHLYAGATGWAWELLERGHARQALAGVWRELRGGGRAKVLAALRPRGLPAALVRLLRARFARPAWLTPHALGLLGEPAAWPSALPRALHPGQHRTVLSLREAFGIATETFTAGSHGIELRYPFRDRRVVELLLRVPADQLYRPGTTRPILRTALDGLLPPSAVERVGKGSLIALFRRGVGERETVTLRSALDAGRAAWERFVRPEWVARAPLGARNGGIEDVVLWRCVLLGRWLDK